MDINKSYSIANGVAAEGISAKDEYMIGQTVGEKENSLNNSELDSFELSEKAVDEPIACEMYSRDDFYKSYNKELYCTKITNCKGFTSSSTIRRFRMFFDDDYSEDGIINTLKSDVACFFEIQESAPSELKMTVEEQKEWIIRKFYDYTNANVNAAARECRVTALRKAGSSADPDDYGVVYAYYDSEILEQSNELYERLKSEFNDIFEEYFGEEYECSWDNNVGFTNAWNAIFDSTGIEIEDFRELGENCVFFYSKCKDLLTDNPNDMGISMIEMNVVNDYFKVDFPWNVKRMNLLDYLHKNGLSYEERLEQILDKIQVKELMGEGDYERKRTDVIRETL